jgi:Uma2 family endonuclease
MVANPKSYVTLEQYYAMLTAEGPAFEWWDGELVMLAGKLPHALIVDNIHGALTAAVAGSECRAFGEGLAVDTPSLGAFRIPDGLVVCGEIETIDRSGNDAITNPLLIVEVTSPTTKALDHGEKFKAYQSIRSLREYLIVEQLQRKVSHWWFNLERDDWLLQEHEEGMISLRWLPMHWRELASRTELVSISIEEIYRGVKLPK